MVRQNLPIGYIKVESGHVIGSKWMVAGDVQLSANLLGIGDRNPNLWLDWSDLAKFTFPADAGSVG